MSNNQSSDHKITRFLSGKGFYLVLALCLAGAGTAAWLAVNNTVGDVEQSKPQNIAQLPPQEEQWGFPQLEEAGQTQSGIEKPLPSSSQPQEQPSSSTEPAASETGLEQSGEPVSSPKLQFVLPNNGEIFADFSNKELVKNETLGDWRTHNGIDIKADAGAEVVSVAAGTVIDVRNDPLWGNVVEVEHAGGLVSIYCGLAKNVAVKKGDAVKTGAKLGTVDYIPSESALPSHLHFELKKDGNWVDPLTTMDKRA